MKPSREQNVAAEQEIDYRSSLLKKLGFIVNLSQSISKQEQINPAVIFSEIIFLYVVRRLGPLMYFEARLWRRDLSLRQKMGFMNGAQYRKRISELNPPNYQKFSQHKLVEKSILTLLGIPTPAFLGFLHPVEGSSKYFTPLTNAAELSNLLGRQRARKVCFKLSEGWGGKGFVAAEISIVDDDGPRLRNLAGQDEFVSVGEFVELYLKDAGEEGLILEEYVEQHDVLRSLNSSSVNTLRIWLIQRQEEVELIGVILRIGRDSQVVDNAERGGLICIVDGETGVVGRMMTPSVIPEFFAAHPDSKMHTEGLQLPFWPACVDLAKRTLKVFPHARFAGLDMAISKTGPVIVELNLQPSKISARNFGAPTSELLS